VKFRRFDVLDDFLQNLHKDGLGFIEYQNNKIPCINVNKIIYDNIVKKTFGKKYVVDVLLNIFYDGKYVFVDIQLEFINLGIEENFLINVNKLDFFEYLYRYGLLAIIPTQYSGTSSSNIFMIQLPNKNNIRNAVEIIKSNLNKIQYIDGE
jgi:hypothetical protein